MVDIRLGGDDQLLYANQSSRSYYKKLGTENKPVHRIGKIFVYYVSNGNIKIRFQENGHPLMIFQSINFEKYFPNVHLSGPDWILAGDSCFV